MSEKKSGIEAELEQMRQELQACNQRLLLMEEALQESDSLPEGRDITERKLAEDALRFSEARYRALFRDNPTMIFTLDTEGTILSVNPTCTIQLGYAIDELEGQPVLGVFHADDRPAVAEQLRICLQNPDQVYRWQFRKIRKDGGLLWVEELVQAVHDLNGVLNVLVVCQDITERKLAEEERERLLLQLEAVLDSINEGVVITDLEGNILTMNPSALTIHEFESVEQARCHLQKYQENFELSDLDGRPVLFDQWPLARVLRGERFEDYEVRVRRKDTGKLWIGSYSGTPVQTKSGEVILLIVTLRDITERKREEEALRKSEQKFSKIFHSVPALIGITTLAEGRCIDINEAGLRTLGYRREEMIGRTMLELGIWESTSSRDRVIRIMEKDGMVRDLEINFRGKNGKPFTGVFSAEIVELNGERYILGMLNDITERKRMEEEIERLNTDLRVRAAELEAANREMEAFNYSVAHDLRNPLNVISSYCQVIKELCSDKLDEQCRRYLQETYDGALRMNRLIEALLNFSHLIHVETRRETVDLSAMANQVAGELKLAGPERRVTFLVADGVSADCDAALLRVVLDNLLGNAWKYTGIREEGIIEFGTTEVDGMPVCFVRDNGTGFNMANAHKLFTPFQRLPGAEECRGFGIGLATAERIIRRHGGRIWAEGEPGKGATFHFTLQPSGSRPENQAPEGEQEA